MKKKILIAFSILIFSFITLNSCSSKDYSLRTTLEKSWNNYLEASESGQESELEKVMSSYRFGTMKNNLISANRSFTPELVKGIASNAPDVSKTEFEDLIENGPTAGLVYVKDSDEKEPEGKPRVNFIFIKFVKERDEWKVDGVMEKGSPKFNEDGSRTKFNLSDLPPTYAIDGQVLAAPKPISAPEVTAMLDVFASGYKIQVIINGTEQANVINTSYSGLVKGGVRKSNNNIVISITQTEKDNPFGPSVTVRCMLADKTAKECFKFEPEKNIEGTHEFSFNVEK